MRAALARLLADVAQDLRLALRVLRTSPAFTATVVLTLALGVGANAAMFGVVDRLLFRPHPYLRDPGAVHRLYFRTEDRGVVTTRRDAEYTRYRQMADWSRAFAQVAGFTHRTIAVGTGEAARERRVAAVSASYFDFFDAPPALGRWFDASEDATPRGADVAVLGYAFWRSAFGGRDVRGEALQVGEIRATIVGVAPAGFGGVEDLDPPAVYVPITTYAGAQPDARRAGSYFVTYQWRWMEMLVRRKPGVSVEQAAADATGAYRRSWLARRELEPSLPPLEEARPRALVAPTRVGAGPDAGLEARTALWVTGVAVVVLLIACANVTNLYLARALARRREVALRVALGVGRGRLLRMALTESLLLALGGGALGLLLAQRGVGIVGRLLLPAEAAREGAASPFDLVDARTLGVALAIAVGAGMLTGLAAALLVGRTDLVSALRAGARGVTAHRSRVRGALLVAQGALSVALLIGAGLFVRSLRHAQAMRLGYDAEPVLLATANVRGTPIGDSGRVALRRALVAAAQAIPGVEHAAWVNGVPLQDESSTRIFVAGIDSVERLGQFTYATATPDYFRTMGTRIVRGRGFTDEDRAAAPRVAVVSEGMARTLWPGREAIGRCFRVFADTMPCATVVGVAEDVAHRDLTTSARLHYYVPIEQLWPAGGSSLLLRLRGDPARQGERVRVALQRLMPGQSYVTVRPLRELVDGARRSWRLGATLFGAFGVLALLVAAVGLYGVVGYDVARRMHELGVRVALGARTADVLRLVVGRGVRLAAAGVALGAALALVAARWLQPLLFEQSATDPRVYGAVGAIMLAVALAACAMPALRAARADPNAALRAE